MLPHEDFNNFPLGAIGNFDGNMNPRDPVEEFLNQTIADPDEHSSTTSKAQYDSDTGIIPTEFESHGVMQVMLFSLICTCCLGYSYCF